MKITNEYLEYLEGLKKIINSGVLDCTFEEYEKDVHNVASPFINDMVNKGVRKPDVLFEAIMLDPSHEEFMKQDCNFELPLKPVSVKEPYAHHSLVGCYCFISLEYGPVYVGKSVNLKNRLQTHWNHRSLPLDKHNRYTEANNLNASLIVCCWYSNRGDYATFEVDIINKLNPMFNIVKV